MKFFLFVRDGLTTLIYSNCIYLVFILHIQLKLKKYSHFSNAAFLLRLSTYSIFEPAHDIMVLIT